MKLIFCGKNEAQISGFAVVKKALKKKIFFRKKILPAYFFKTVCGNFLKINGSRDI